ncbi:MAG: sigma-70 family RNA polymerase sigma factor [Myxococcota bacterium]
MERRSTQNDEAKPIDTPPDDASRQDDRPLVERARRGDQDAFRQLVERHERRAYAVALRVVRNPDEARDIVQEAFIKAWRKLDGFHGTSLFSTWLHRIVMNVGIDHKRREKRVEEYDDKVARGEAVDGDENILPRMLDANPAKNLGRRELAEQMNRALTELSPEHRAVLVMREVEGMSYKEIAKAMKCAKGTIMSRLFHARRRMQRLMLDYLGNRADLKAFGE